MDKEQIESILQDKVKTYRSQYIQTISGKEYFLKEGMAGNMYKCEANGLKELSRVESVQIAGVVSVGSNYILTEYVRRGSPSNDCFIEFGRQLARIHRFQSESFGFYENNYIGNNVQVNIPDKQEGANWIDFYFHKRLLFQYKLAEKNGYMTQNLKNGFVHLENRIESILKESLELPCLLHGDLWAGNFICDETDHVVLIDPAVYYGHREADLAMTRLFGGFPPMFYDSYQQEYPLKARWEYREGLYKLYHVLNHLNLFGRGYIFEAESLLAAYCG